MLTTPRLLLRGPVAGDLDDLHAILRDPRAMRYWSTPPHPDLTTTRTQLDGMLDHKGVLTYFMIERNKRLIGMAGMHHDNEVGFILHPDYWRQGLLKEAMGCIIPYLWRVTPVDRLFADADPRNAASVGLLCALGFTETHRASRTYCVDGVWSDSVYFALERPSN